MLLFVYTTTHKRFVIFTCRYFKLRWNTTALNQSNCRNFSCSGINVSNNCLCHSELWSVHDCSALVRWVKEWWCIIFVVFCNVFNFYRVGKGVLRINWRVTKIKVSEKLSIVVCVALHSIHVCTVLKLLHLYYYWFSIFLITIYLGASDYATTTVAMATKGHFWLYHFRKGNWSWNMSRYCFWDCNRAVSYWPFFPLSLGKWQSQNPFQKWRIVSVDKKVIWTQNGYRQHESGVACR